MDEFGNNQNQPTNQGQNPNPQQYPQQYPNQNQMQNTSPYQSPYQNQNQGYYNAPDEQPKGSKGMAITSLVFGIISIVCCCCIPLPFSIVGLILSIICLVKHKAGKGLAIAGLITNIIGTLTGIYMVFSVIISLGGISGVGKFVEIIPQIQEDFPEIVENYDEDESLPDYLEPYRDLWEDVWATNEDQLKDYASQVETQSSNE